VVSWAVTTVGIVRNVENAGGVVEKPDSSHFPLSQFILLPEAIPFPHLLHLLSNFAVIILFSPLPDVPGSEHYHPAYSNRTQDGQENRNRHGVQYREGEGSEQGRQQYQFHGVTSLVCDFHFPDCVPVGVPEWTLPVVRGITENPVEPVGQDVNRANAGHDPGVILLERKVALMLPVKSFSQFVM